ncbi:hypothetical protein HanIR_Chr13g0659671 [Helianthus annuus]|nr:hypothetical protein HanIR_Chr13g0659671 [Helianthus annuus]
MNHVSAKNQDNFMCYKTSSYSPFETLKRPYLSIPCHMCILFVNRPAANLL